MVFPVYVVFVLLGYFTARFWRFGGWVFHGVVWGWGFALDFAWVSFCIVVGCCLVLVVDLDLLGFDLVVFSG